MNIKNTYMINNRIYIYIFIYSIDYRICNSNNLNRILYSEITN